MSRPKKPCITRHALERAVDRLGCTDHREAYRLLMRAWQGSIKIPYRFARHLCQHATPAKQRAWHKRQFRIAGTTLLVCRGRHVLTTWKLSEDELATVLWWTVSNRWLA